MNLNEFKQEVHALAVEKGFYDLQPTDAELIAAIHSEISEAFDEWNASRPMVYRACVEDLRISISRSVTYCEAREKGQCRFSPLVEPGGKGCYSKERHGIAVELIDVVLRLLDTAAAWNIALRDDYWTTPDPDSLVDSIKRITNEIIERFTMPELACELHRMAVELRRQREVEASADDISHAMSQMIGLVYVWLRARDIDPEALLQEKHRYNQTRPYKHGGKRI